MRFFFDAEKDTLKNTELFKSRIMGLVSFYRTFKKDLMPDIGEERIINVPMSQYQFDRYAAVRKAEIDQDKGKKRHSPQKRQRETVQEKRKIFLK